MKLKRMTGLLCQSAVAGLLFVSCTPVSPVGLTSKAKLVHSTAAITSGAYPYAKIVLNFNSAPTAVTVQKAALRYNKDFAYSLTLDDGTLDHYTHVYPLLQGGHSDPLNRDFPGLAFTDGCGNFVPFTGALAWNSTNAYHYKLNDGFDPHLDNSSGNVSWTQLGLMMASSWDVLNHSYAHLDSGAGITFDPGQQISLNTAKIASMVGYNTTDFVIPSGWSCPVKTGPSSRLDFSVLFHA